MNKHTLAVLASFAFTISLPFGASARDVVALAAVSGPASPSQPLGRFELFASDSDSGVLHTWQLSDQKGWQQTWQRYLPAPDKNPRGLVAGRDNVGRMVVAWLSQGGISFAEAVHDDASLFTSSELTISSQIDPNDGKDYRFKALIIARYPKGPVEILALSDRGRVWSTRQRSIFDDGKPWIGATRDANGHRNNHLALVGGGDLQQISVANLGDSLALVGLGKNGQVYVKRQSSPETWVTEDAWENLGGNQVKEVRAQESKDHQLEVLALGSDEKYYINYENVGTHTFSGWQVLNTPTNQKIDGSFFFDRFNDGTLSVTTHFYFDDPNSQFKGTFAKTFQSPNNGGWSGQLCGYAAVTIHPAGVTNPDSLGFLSADAFTLAHDVNGNINYFANYRNGSQVEHYIDKDDARCSTTTGSSLLVYQDAEHSIPNLP
jgi:hypothetical protein